MSKFLLAFCVMLCPALFGCSIFGNGFGAHDPWESYVRQDRHATFDEVKLVMLQCGYAKVSYSSPIDKPTANDEAIREECMFAKGYLFAGGWGGMCSDPDRRATLPACKDAPVRPRNR